jgi:hypothetical protein
VAISYGIYDPQANRGSIFVGTSHDTADWIERGVGVFFGPENPRRESPE